MKSANTQYRRDGTALGTLHMKRQIYDYQKEAMLS